MNSIPKAWESSVFLWIVTNPSGWKPLKKTVYDALSRFRTKIIVINLKGESLKQKSQRTDEVNTAKGLHCNLIVTFPVKSNSPKIESYDKSINLGYRSFPYRNNDSNK
jgi:hypothetical protein